MFILWIIPTIFSLVATACNPAEFMSNGICCSKCNPGSVVKLPCTLTSPSTVCMPCVDGTYMDHPNGVDKCLKCTECDTGAGLMEVKKCTYFSNTECECKPGFYCPTNRRPCDVCAQHTICPPGQYIKEQGTSTSDNVCAYCPEGTFSTSDMSKTCTQWTKCSEKDRAQYKQGTATTDSVCVDKRNYYSPIAIIIVPLLLFILYWKRTPDKQESKDLNNPVQETHSANR